MRAPGVLDDARERPTSAGAYLEEHLTRTPSQQIDRLQLRRSLARSNDLIVESSSARIDFAQASDVEGVVQGLRALPHDVFAHSASIRRDSKASFRKYAVRCMCL